MAKRTTYDISFILFLTSICHVLFSNYGFNPTDEGFVLSATNRVMNGQIPHVDFSSVRPLGYAYLHIPELLISKTRFFLVSRFVFWLEQVLIAFLWIRFILSYSKTEISLLKKYTLILICFVFNVHYFPASVLHTIDGLLMCMIGLNLITTENKWNFIGFIFIGFAALCKQNYLVVLPFTLVLFGRKKLALNTIFGFFPLLIYILLISIYGGWNDLMVQLSGHNELLKVGVFSYLSNPVVYAGFIGLLVYRKLNFDKLYLSVLVLLFACILMITNHYHGKFGFLFLGIIGGELLYQFNQKESVTLPIVTALLAWSVSISVGYNTPALFIGGVLSMLLFYSIISTQTNYLNRSIIVVLALLIITFYYTRTHTIYRELTVKNLTYKLDNLVEGAYGIYTNKNTYLVLQELDSLKKSIPNLLVIPDFTACNILHSHQSKILTEWPNKTEIPNDRILEKITSKIKNDSTLVFAIPKYQTALLKDSFVIQPNSGMEYPIINFVISNYQVAEEKKYFLYFRKVFSPSKVIDETEYNN
jgi:hypothetical protein